jgi:hypothetical protein
MVRRPKADWVLGVWGFGVFAVFGVLEILGFQVFKIIRTHCNMLQTKIHEPNIFEARKIKFEFKEISDLF